MPRPIDERQSIERGRAELPAQLAAWQISEREERLAEIERRLVAMKVEE